MAFVVEHGLSSAEGQRPAPRGGHTATMAENQIVFFGGSSYKEGGKFEYHNDVHVLDTEQRLWYKVQCGGDQPPPRYGHSVELVGSRMFVFFGRGESGALRDTYFLDLVEWTWVAVSVTSACPAPRFGHASLLVGRKVVVHGGWDGRAHCWGDLWVFNTEAFTWLQPAARGIAPSPRHGHVMELVHDGRILCFGGSSTSAADPVPEYYGDLRQLDTETMIWSKPGTGGDAPSARYGLRSAHVDGALVFFGGWGKNGVQDSNCRNKGAGSLFLLGTAPQHGAPSLEWHQPEAHHSLVPAHKYGHTMTAVGSTLYVFGGWNGKQACDDLLEINIQAANN
ncbi:hypothetical protein M885DRAFT_477663 [Pelagophyceae sp. CCMP2097]|nr:hypothetical protein M885DRAFT_477663 [Pelagophyceae sp. CCMP2097]|mmetsp:Transcript_4971/g.15745  ORF Transcript_4971/g.15745 Transcript_4971/m.15745 type:complete len:337 (+) Transcript_4971:94-1104(+)